MDPLVDISDGSYISDSWSGSCTLICGENQYFFCDSNYRSYKDFSADTVISPVGRLLYMIEVHYV